MISISIYVFSHPFVIKESMAVLTKKHIGSSKQCTLTRYGQVAKDLNKLTSQEVRRLDDRIISLHTAHDVSEGPYE